jgi:hypothetical protein
MSISIVGGYDNELYVKYILMFMIFG